MRSELSGHQFPFNKARSELKKMISVIEVKTKKQQREFLNFPLVLYKNVPCFCPPLYGDEKKIFKADYVYYDRCEAVYYNAYENGVMVGRISGILQKAHNEKTGEKRVRFTRFDSVNDQKVADTLFEAVEKWAVSKGMDTVCGPLGFSDLEREGLLTKGFDQMSTFEEQYNYEYYQTLIESRGYTKEAVWNESRIYAPDQHDEKLRRLAQVIMKRYKLRYGQAKNVNDFIKKYGDAFFELLDKSYADIYGTVPFTDGMKKMLISNFKLIVDLRYICVVLDENDRLVCLGLCFPSISAAVRKSNGHLTPAALARLLKAVKKPRVIDFGLVGVDPEYANRGIGALVTVPIMDILEKGDIEYAETNLNLVGNAQIQNMWNRFNRVIHKERCSYIKKLEV